MTARKFHDESLARESAKTADFRYIRGPHFCSTRITEDARKCAAERRIAGAEALKEGWGAKSKEFVEQGQEGYAVP
ncbi:MAG: hypothetical protein HYY24_11475 [Verrucomicrobia bacterium]|nr:hypothetical protein [Verrucomicrobiota bacterium]